MPEPGAPISRITFSGDCMVDLDTARAYLLRVASASSWFFFNVLYFPLYSFFKPTPCIMLSEWLGKSKTAGLRVVSAHISSLPVNERFTDTKLSALVLHHPGKSFVSSSSSSSTAAPPPPITFALRARPPYYTKSLYVESRSGGFVDCSWRKCVANFFGKHDKKRAIRERVLNALRNEAFRSEKMKKARASLGHTCAECGVVCRKLVVDHAGMPFAQIVDEFVAGKNVAVSALPVRFARGAYCLKSGGKAWRVFHDERAELVGLCAKCNMRLGSRGYRSKELCEHASE